jgi:hypothetical protein
VVICCQDCGIIIYWDDDMKEPVDAIDDMSRPPYITAQGGLFCCWCGERYDEAEEEAEDWKFEDEYGGTEEKNASTVTPKPIGESKNE